MTVVIAHFLIFTIVIFSNGQIIKNIFISKSFKINNLEVFFIGIVATGFVAQLISFFFSLSDLILYINLIFTLFILSKFKGIQFRILHIFYVVLFIICISNIYSSGFSDDINHYHASLIQNYDNSKLIVGINNLHNHFGYNSMWLYLHSYLNFNKYFLQDIHVLNSIIFFGILVYLLSEIITNENNYKTKVLAIFLILFFLFKYTRLKEFGLDRPGVIIFCFINYFSFKYFKSVNELNDKKILNTILVLFCLFLTSIKIFFIFSFIIPLTFLFADYLKYKKLLIFYTFPIIFLFIYCLKNTLISGCIIYPFSFTCIEILPWNSKIVASELLINTEAAAKGFPNYIGEYQLQEYIKNFNWIDTWVAKFLEEFLNYFYTILFSLILTVLSLKINNFKPEFNFNNIHKVLAFLILALNIFIFLKSPVTRYHHIFFISIGTYLIYFFDFNYLFKKKTFLIILCIALIFNFSKNMIRINKQNYKNDPIQLIKKQGKYYKPIKNNLNGFTYYTGWIDGHPIGNLSLENKNYIKIFNYDVIF